MGGNDANVKNEKKKKQDKKIQGLFDLSVFLDGVLWHHSNALCLLLAGDRRLFLGQQHPLSTAHFRNAISKLPAEVEGVFAKTVDRAKLLPDQNPATGNSWAVAFGG